MVGFPMIPKLPWVGGTDQMLPARQLLIFNDVRIVSVLGHYGIDPARQCDKHEMPYLNLHSAIISA